jgi:hypothetical protein
MRRGHGRYLHDGQERLPAAAVDPELVVFSILLRDEDATEVEQLLLLLLSS